MIKIFKYFSKLGVYNSNLDMIKLNKVLKTTEFKQMQSLEKVQDFTEAMIDKKTNTRKSFFRLGPNNDWKKASRLSNLLRPNENNVGAIIIAILDTACSPEFLRKLNR